MSEARNGRFDIDIEEIERQLRRSSESAPASRPDPLAELARIVGQDDPFRGILGDNRVTASGSRGARSDAHGEAAPHFGPHPDAGHTDQGENGYRDPVADAYGAEEALYRDEEVEPLQPRRSRGRLVAAALGLLATAGAIGGGLWWHKGGNVYSAGAAPPVITADKTPLKVAPQNPGGLDVPNQDRQIYERGAKDGQSRIVDGREQPIDVREATRNMPQPAIAGRPPGASEARPVASNGGGPLTAALGEPKRVRTTSIRPDGTPFTPSATGAPDPAASPAMPGTIPPPVPVATTPASSPQPRAAFPAPTLPAQGSEPTDSARVTETSPPTTASTMLPPRRPKLDTSDAADAPTRTASVSTSPENPVEGSAARTFTVQLASLPTEEAARAAYTQMLDKYPADLEGRRARVVKAEVNGKTVHRIRVGPMTKDEATGLCTRLKAAGGSCSVAGGG